MEIVKLACDNIDELLDEILKSLCKQNKKYVVLNYDYYIELHMDNYIYRIINFETLKQLNLIADTFHIYDPSIPNNIKDQDIKININYKEKEQSGYKKYTKKDIKKGNMKLPKLYR